jgi:hypothetical protein
MVSSAQRGLASGANEVLEFGLFESAIVRLHGTLRGDRVADTDRSDAGATPLAGTPNRRS